MQPDMELGETFNVLVVLLAGSFLDVVGFIAFENPAKLSTEFLADNNQCAIDELGFIYCDIHFSPSVI